MEKIDRIEIEKLNSGESYVIPESDYGKAEVWRLNNMYILFSIPMYGGEPTFEGCFGTHRLDDLLSKVYYWT